MNGAARGALMAGPASAARTLAVFHLAETSGPSRSLERELRWLADEGSVEVVVPGRGAGSEATGAVADSFGDFAPVTALDFEALTLPRGPLAAARTARRVTREARMFRALIRERRPDLVVVASVMLPAALIAARRERAPAIAYAGELFPGAGAAAGRRGVATAAKALGGRSVTALTGSLADAVLACSRTVAAQYDNARRAEVAVLYPAIPDLSGGDGPGFRAALGIGPGDPLVAAVGNITQNRGQDVLIAALPAIRAKVPGARAVIVGAPHPRAPDLAYRDRLVAQARGLGLADAVTFAGHRDDVADVYAAADLVVNPRRVGEAFGRVPAEALAAGTPVVAMREGAVPEVLRDGETALLVEPGDSEALAAASVRLLTDEALRERLVADGRRDVLRRFSPQRSLAEFRRVVEGVRTEAEAARAAGR